MANLVVAENDKLPAHLKNLKGDNRGSENVTKEDLVIPRLGLFQALSPQMDKDEPEYMPDAELGQLFNHLTGQIYGEELLVVPVLFERMYLLWKDRKQGGGFAGAYPSLEAANDEIIRMAREEENEGWEAVFTPTFLCLAISGNEVSEIAIPMPISKVKVSRAWNSLIRLTNAPSFAGVYKISGVSDKNDAGEKYYNFKVNPAGFPSKELFEKAEKLYTEISTGEINYDIDQGEEAEV